MAGDPLSKRERQIAMHYADGDNYRDIASKLGIAPATVRTHLGTIYRKLGVSSKVALLKEIGFAKEVAAPVELPAIPSLAVLPFKATETDEELSLFASGLAEELSNALSRAPDMFVTSESASARAAATGSSLAEIGATLGVKYALDGSVRSSGDRLRVTARLHECATGRTVWTERYETTLTDVFDVQDDITRSVAVSLQVNLTYGEMSRLWEGQTRNLRAWEKMAEGRRIFNRFTQPDMIRARVLFEEALEIDPNFSAALLHLGLTHWWEARYVLERPVEDALSEAERIVFRMRDMGADESSACYLEGYVAFIRTDHSRAIELMEKATQLSPSDSWKIACLGQVRIFAGKDREGIADLRRAMRLSPFYPDWYPYNLVIGMAWLGEGKEVAMQISQEYRERIITDPYGWTNRAIVAEHFGESEIASMEVAELKAKYPEFGLKNIERSELYSDPSRLGFVLSVLRRKGLSN